MFEDLIDNKPKKKQKDHTFYICELSTTCEEKYCLHKFEHEKDALGRPEQGDDEDPCDCSKIKCGKHGAICVPV